MNARDLVCWRAGRERSPHAQEGEREEREKREREERESKERYPQRLNRTARERERE